MPFKDAIGHSLRMSTRRRPPKSLSMAHKYKPYGSAELPYRRRFNSSDTDHILLVIYRLCSKSLAPLIKFVRNCIRPKIIARAPPTVKELRDVLRSKALLYESAVTRYNKTYMNPTRLGYWSYCKC